MLKKPTVFLVDAIEQVPDPEVARAPEHMKRAMFFAAKAAQTLASTPKRAWTDELSPADELLEEYQTKLP